jgi:hypothetical protein
MTAMRTPHGTFSANSSISSRSEEPECRTALLASSETTIIASCITGASVGSEANASRANRGAAVSQGSRRCISWETLTTRGYPILAPSRASTVPLGLGNRWHGTIKQP